MASTPALLFRSVAASHAPSASVAAFARPSRRQFVALASSPASSSLAHNVSPTHSLPPILAHYNKNCARRAYSLDRPNSSPLSLFSSPGGSSNDSSPYGQTLEISRWPITKTNTILNIVPQGKRMVVERFGKLQSIHESGYFLAVPFVDSIAYVIDVRERAVDILPQSAITRDNVSVEVSGNLFVRVVDPERAAYGARNPLYAVMMVSEKLLLHLIASFLMGEDGLGNISLNSCKLRTLLNSTISCISLTNM